MVDVNQHLWGKVIRNRSAVFLRMRIYNFAIVGYAGEAYLAFWARNNLQRPIGEIVAAVKDSSILSGLASNSFTLILLAIFFATGQLEQITSAGANYDIYIAAVAFTGFILLPLVIKYHSKILRLTPKSARHIFSIHLLRIIIILALQTGQWAVVFPQVAIETWLLILTAQMIIVRVPFLPNSDLMAMGLGISMIGYIDGPAVALAGMFLASGALAQILNLGGFLVTSFGTKVPKEESVAIAAAN